ncbi:AAA family ATPase [Salipiger abyssi]|uniref:AAA family ATPase n=1 Tax=Salipiger abyssi TaxID=1250539 RepID=UPI001A8EE72D|nr:AAA family ATPase [Salipiger abyssi]MBN9889684.1 AAA family ATPase [Salipiger abyssi]
MTAQTALENIPQELRSYPQWVCHDAAKRPINPHTGQLADVSDPTTWGSFDQARTIAEAGRCAGVGFVFTDSDPFVGIDLDVSEGSGPSDGQQRIFGAFNTYAEHSPSARGLHIIAKGRVSDGGVRNSALGVEVYSSGRFFTFTGNVVRSAPIAECQPLVDALCAEIRPHRDTGAGETPNPCPAPQITDETLRERICESAANRDYYEGRVSDWSAAYFALICAACLFSSDEAQVRRIVMASPLVQDAPPKGRETRAQKAERLWAREYASAARRGAQERQERTQAVEHGRQLAAGLSGQLARATAPAQGQDEKPGRSLLRSARDLQHRHFPAIRWAVPNVLPEGLTIFAGVPKVGKSWFALDVARAKADGDCVLGQQCDRGDVLMLALEDNERRLQDRFRRITGGGDFPDNLDYATEWPRLDEGGVDYVANWIEGAANPSLIVIDTLAMVKPVPTGRNKSAYDHDVSALKPLHRLASEKRVAIVVVTHTRKAQADEPVERVSSTLGLTGVADTIMLLGRGPREATGILYARGRDIAEFELAVKFEDHRWQVEGDPKLAFAGDTQKILIDAMTKGATTPKEMEEATGLSGENVRQTLQRMVKAQRVFRHGYGKYALPAWTDTPAFLLDTPHHTSHSHNG